mmetsp:Transcript_29733/g.95144  ORF Transcript_29733/g.95144 Transcript_29733/m.95144 type:complete len:83 (+) Transcript_29733:456-704(+)
MECTITMSELSMKISSRKFQTPWLGSTMQLNKNITIISHKWEVDRVKPSVFLLAGKGLQFQSNPKIVDIARHAARSYSILVK